jgi:hypothetical protein
MYNTSPSKTTIYLLFLSNWGRNFSSRLFCQWIYAYAAVNPGYLVTTQTPGTAGGHITRETERKRERTPHLVCCNGANQFIFSTLKVGRSREKSIRKVADLVTLLFSCIYAGVCKCNDTDWRRMQPKFNFTLCSPERRVAFCLVRGGIPTWRRARRKRRRPLERFQEYFDHLTAFCRDIGYSFNIDHNISNNDTCFYLFLNRFDFNLSRTWLLYKECGIHHK